MQKSNHQSHHRVSDFQRPHTVAHRYNPHATTGATKKGVLSLQTSNKITQLDNLGWTLEQKKNYSIPL